MTFDHPPSMVWLSLRFFAWPSRSLRFHPPILCKTTTRNNRKDLAKVRKEYELCYFPFSDKDFR